MQIYDHQAHDAVALARSFPDTKIVIEHLAWPVDLSESGFERWARHAAPLAECPNVFMKVSGIGCVFQRSSSALVLQYLHQAVATFGAARCMFGSNCPPDTLYYEFGQLLETYCGAFSSLSASEQQDIFRGTARRSIDSDSEQPSSNAHSAAGDVSVSRDAETDFPKKMIGSRCAGLP
jgi:predicted TIM-barrel fold metal-dependent hydrolase